MEKPEANLHPYTVEILKKLGEENETEFVIGGGVALCHYITPRDTVDLDGWWKTDESALTIKRLEDILTGIARRKNCVFNMRRFNDVISLELFAGAQNKVYSVQIAKRDKYLEEPALSVWNVPIETLKDNIGSKMKALINRGTPRDFLDIFKICTEGKATPEECWDIATQAILPQVEPGSDKTNPKATNQIIQQGKAEITRHLLQLESRRPLPPASPDEPEQTRNARTLRNWYKTKFLPDQKTENNRGPRTGNLAPPQTMSANLKPHEFWRGLDLTVMPDGDIDLIPFPTPADVGDYLEGFCRQLDNGIGSVDDLIRLLDKPETIPAMELAGTNFLDNSPAYQTLRLLANLDPVEIRPATPWAPEPAWMKQDRLEGRPPDNSPA